MKKTFPKKQLLTALKESGEVFKSCARRAKLLNAIAWKSEVAEEFFRKKEMELPKPVYAVDKKTCLELLELLADLRPKIAGEHPVLKWLEKTRDSFANGIHMMLEIEKDAFFTISKEVYGSSTSRAFEGETTNLELARGIASRMKETRLNDVSEQKNHQDAKQFARGVEEKLKRRVPPLNVKVEVSDQLVSKVAAGVNRIRVRADATFADIELEALWNHEVESHCLTAQNGAKQEICDFLMAGGPRTTMTQEGLAVFYEVYGHTMSQNRFLTLCNRVEANHMAESGADFMQIYRWYRTFTDSPMEAFYNSQRVFRGAKLTGGAGFTKDVVYLAGLLGVYNFLRLAVKSQNRLLVESLVNGRVALEDVGIIAWLRAHGIVTPPAFQPYWLSNWEALLSFFTLTHVLGTMNLTDYHSYFDKLSSLEEWDLSVS